MGEAKRKKQAGANDGSDRRSDLKATFERLGIDYSLPGFYDDPAFIAREANDARFLETYSEWVMLRERSPEEDARVRDIVPRMAAIINARLDRHEWYGACLPITAMMCRMLERMGIFVGVIRGSVTIKDRRRDLTRHLAIIDTVEGPATDTGHMWLAIPPFEIVDLTLHHQRWRTDNFQRSVPAIVLAEQTTPIIATAHDVIAPEVLAAGMARQFQHRVNTRFPAKMVSMDPIQLRYVPAGAPMPGDQLETINAGGSAGAPAIRIWREDVMPAFGLSEEPLSRAFPLVPEVRY